MLYYINFEVDDGYSRTRDVALVDAENSDDAIKKLEKFIGSKDSETFVRRIYETVRWNREVFTGKHGMR